MESVKPNVRVKSRPRISLSSVLHMASQKRDPRKPTALLTKYTPGATYFTEQGTRLIKDGHYLKQNDPCGRHVHEYST